MRWRQGLRLQLSLAFAVGSASCSFMQLDEFGAQACTIDDDCAAANRAAQIDPVAACIAYRCNRDSGHCEQAPRDSDGDETFDAELCRGEVPEAELDCADRDGLRSPRLPEACDGIDNDCDRWIDEEVLPESAPRPIKLGFTMSELAYSVTEDGTALFALTHRIDETNHGTTRLMLNDDPATAWLADEEAGCTLAGGGCNFTQVALDATQELVLDLGVNKVTCDDGQIRVGIGSLSPMHFDLGSHAPDTQKSFAPDIDSAGANACTLSTACQGADEIALALLPSATASEERQALALWLAPDDARCDEDPVAFDADSPHALVGLGLRVRQARALLEPNPSAGSAVLLRGITARQRPSLLAFSDGPAVLPSGYLVAHIEREGPVLLAIPTPDAATDHLRARPVGRIDDRGATQVALAASPARNLQGLALAWRSRTKSGDAIRFAELQLAGDPAAGPEIALLGDSIAVADASAIVEGPVVAFAPDGFSATAPAGGWLIAWIEAAASGRRLMVARIAQAERRLLGAPIELAQGELHHVFAYAKRSSLDGDDRFAIRYGFLRDDELRIGEASCGPLD